MSLIDTILVKQTPTSYLLGKLSESACKTKASAEKAYNRFIFKDLLDKGSQLLSKTKLDMLQLEHMGPSHYVSGHTLFEKGILQVALDERTNKHRVTRFGNSKRSSKILKTIAKTFVRAMKTAAFAGLTVLSLPLSVPYQLVFIGRFLAETLSVGNCRLKRELKVEVLDASQTNRTEVLKTIDAWQRVAEEKLKQAPKDNTQFSGNIYIAGWTRSNLINIIHDPSKRILICYDIKWNIPQAIAVAENQNDKDGQIFKYVHSVLTNPINIRSEVNKTEPKRVRGAATAILAALGAMCLAESIDKIRLLSLPSSHAFYTKLGFAGEDVNISDYLTLPKERYPSSKQLAKI